jgi:Tol biopolymer transport system component
VVGASWTTFSPDESKVIVAANGLLTLRDVSTAHRAPSITSVTLPSTSTGEPYFGSMPDWAPDGRHVVFTATSGDLPTAKMARHIRGSAIAWLGVQGTTFSGFELLTDSRGVLTNDCQAGLSSPDNVAIHGPGRESFANPIFSPDSAWIAFSRGDCESEGDPSAELIVTRAERGAPMDHLVRMNTDVAGAALSNLTNGMPTWGPRIKSNVAWIAFTSTRNYGLVIAPGTGVLHRVGWPVRQLWVAAIDMTKLGTGQEASYPAFRMPSQDYDENNHRPFWTVDVIPDAPVNIDPRVN